MTEPIKDLTAALRRLDISNNQQTVFLSLVQDGTASARTLTARTNLTRPSVYDQLKALRAAGLVVELNRDGTTEFAAIDLSELDHLLADKIERIERSRASLTASLPDLLNASHTVSPKIRFFEGAEEVKNILKDVLWNVRDELTIIWPSEQMSGVFDTAYLTWFVERVAAHSIQATIYTDAGHPFFDLKNIKKQKTLPLMATIIYGHRIAHISSNAEAFGFIVESEEYATMTKMLHK